MPRAIRMSVLLLLAVSCLSEPQSAQDFENSDPSTLMKESPKTVAHKPAMAPSPKKKMAQESDLRGGAATEDKSTGKEKGKKATTWKRSTVLPNTTKLMIGDQESLKLKGTQIHIQVDGFRARVVLDAYYENPHDRQYEGTFKLRLPPGASPYYFAFGQTVVAQADQPPFFTAQQSKLRGVAPQEIRRDRQETWTQVKEARMVPKEKAAHAYHDTVRRQVDPALMEWSGAGVFSARVFPLLPKKQHRVVIGYDMDLQAVGDDLEYRFDVPKTEADCLVDLSVAVLPGIKIEVTPPQKGAPDGPRHYFHFRNPAVESLSVSLRKPKPLLLTGTDPQTGPYFAASFKPSLPAASASSSKIAVFMVDTSLSANPDQMNVWLQLLETLLNSNRPGLKRFAVLFFNIEAHWWQPQLVDNTPEQVHQLMRYAKQLALEGATDLGAAFTAAAAPPWKRATSFDLFLLSDGAATWGENDLHVLTGLLPTKTPVFTYTTGMTGTDRRTLAFVARETGGAVFTVAGEADLQKAATAHRFRPWLLDKVEVLGAGDFMIAGRPLALYPGQRLQLVGRADGQSQLSVRLQLQRDGQKHQVTEVLQNGLESPLAARAYGQVAVEQLEEFKTATEDIATAYACHFRITGNSCSLLMLESEADYQRYNIKPEEHAFVIKKRPAAAVVAQVLAQIGDALKNPKKAFLAWLKKMTDMPGVKLKVPTALKVALEQMPATSFAVKVPPLKSKEHSLEVVSPKVQKQLREREIVYVDLVGEADRRFKQWGAASALRGLSSLVENSPGDAVLARDVGFSAMSWGLKGQAYYLFRRVAAARPHEPQTYRAMAQVLAEMGQTDLALAYYEVALAGQWDSRFGEYQKILALDYLRFLQAIKTGKKTTSVADFATSRLSHVAKQLNLDRADLLVSITWNTDGTDVDLHVIEPTGEDCYYGNSETKLGGQLTTDVTEGYGPEMYVLKKAPKGVYRIEAHYFASDVNRASARTKVYATVYRGWGGPRETRTEKVITLEQGKEQHVVLNLKVP